MNIKKLTSLALSLLLVLAMAAPAMASGLTGTITISNASDGTLATGRTFEAYRILDVTLASDGTTPSYSVPTSMEGFYATQFGLDFSGMTKAQINAAVIDAIADLDGDDDAMQEFAEAAIAAAKLAGVPHVTVPGGTTTPVPYGYYVIEQTSGLADDARVSSVMVSTTNPDAEIVLKADTPNIVKTIVGGEEPDSDNVSIGDEVKYQIATKVPDMTGFDEKYFFIVTDTLSNGLDFNNNVVVTLDGAPLIAGDDYYVNWTSPDGKTFQVVFKDFIERKGVDEGKPIVITYSAILNDKAVVGEVGNPNSAKLTYSNNPQNEGSGKPGTPDEPDEDDVTGESPLDKTITYTTGIHLTKVDEAGNPLTGAKFKLEGTSLNKVVVEGEVFTLDAGGAYWLLKDGTYTTVAPTDLTKGLYASETDKYKKETKTTITSTGTTTKVVEGWVGADGVLKFDGLSAGTYTLTELVSPSGYNLLTSPIVFVISWTKPAGPIASGTETATWTVSATMGGAEVTTEVLAGIITLDVENNKGTLLPSTGGMGTTLFTIGGIVLMGLAVLLLVLRKKQSKA